MVSPWEDRLVHYEYVEELVEGRRVLEIGCGAGQGANFIARLARQVIATDVPSSGIELAASAARPNVELRTSEPDRLEVEDRSIDVVLVPQLERWVTRGTFMPEVRRVLSPGGVALFAVRAGDDGGGRGMAYADFLEYLTQSFPHVRMLGEIPFHGLILADFQPEPDVTPQLDSSLVEEDEPPLFYLALCSDNPVRPLGYSVIQVPPPAGLPAAGLPAAGLPAAAPPEEPQGRLRRLLEERAEAELEVERLRAQLADAERRLLEAGASNRQELKSLRIEAQEKQLQVERLTRQTQELRQQLEQARADLVRREEEAGALGGDAGAAVALLRQRLEASDARAADDARRLAELEKRLEREVGRAEGLEARLQAERDRLDRERERAEAAVRHHLEERSRAEIQQARAAMAEKAIAEMRAALEQQRQRADAAERRSDTLMIRLEQGAADLTTLHQRLAEMQGLHQADQWRIDELLGRLRQLELRAMLGVREELSPAGVAGAPGLGPHELAPALELESARARLAELERELAALRQAEQAAQAAEQRAAEAGGEVAAATQRAAELESSLEQATRQLAQRERRLEEVETELMKSESRVVEANRRATNNESKVVQLEVRLKRVESEAATLSKWAEELREELKEAQGKSSVRPATPEPEVAALRNDLREARERITELEQRCDRFMKEAQAATNALREKEAALAEAMRAADGTLLAELQELKGLRAQVEELEGIRQRSLRIERQLAETEGQLRDAEQAETELQRTRRELSELRSRVRDVDAASEELEQLRLRAVQFADNEEELERLRAELETTRIALARCEEERRGAAGLPQEAVWRGLEEEEEEEAGEAEVEGYVGEEIAGATDLEEEEEPFEPAWELDERLRVRERQLEALLEGAALHREEMERYRVQIGEMDGLIQEMKAERDALERLLGDCNARRFEEGQALEQLREESQHLRRELARINGELRRCQEERAALGDAAGGEREAGGPDETQRGEGQDGGSEGPAGGGDSH